MLATMPAACRPDAAISLALRDRLVCEHLWLVDALARRAQRKLPRAFELDDLVSAGRMGLIGAAERYQPELYDWAPFAAFARPAVHGAIMLSVRAVWSDGRNRQALRPVCEPLTAADEPAHDGAHYGAEAALHNALDGERRALTLARAVRALPGPAQRLFRVVYEGERITVRAAAARLGIPPSRAYRLHKSGVNALRELLSA